MAEVEIKNAKITSTYLGEVHSCLTADLILEGAGWQGVYGGYCLAKWNDPQKLVSGAGAIISLLKALELDNWEQLTGIYVRVKTEGWGGKIVAVGHIIREKWFSFKDYFEEAKKLQNTDAESNSKEEVIEAGR